MSRPAPSALPVPLRAPLKPKRQLITSSLGARGNADRETVPSWQGLWAWGGGCRVRWPVPAAGRSRASQWGEVGAWGGVGGPFNAASSEPSFSQDSRRRGHAFLPGQQRTNIYLPTRAPTPPGRQRPDVSSFLSLRGGAGQGEGESGVAGPGQQQPRRAAGDARAVLGAAASRRGRDRGRRCVSWTPKAAEGRASGDSLLQVRGRVLTQARGDSCAPTPGVRRSPAPSCSCGWGKPSSPLSYPRTGVRCRLAPT